LTPVKGQEVNERRQREGVFIDNQNPQPSWRKRDLAGSHDNLVCLAGKLGGHPVQF